MTILKPKKHQVKHTTLWVCIAYTPCAQTKFIYLFETWKPSTMPRP